MGNRLSLMAPSAPTVAISSYVDFLENIEYIELVNNQRLFKTIKAIDHASGSLVLIKVLIKPPSDGNNLNLKDITELTVKDCSRLSYSNIVLPWFRIIETDRAAYMIRQWIKTNLYDRISLKPFLEPTEKLFLTFQMLKIIDTIHNEMHIRHGDLKLENFMVTSSNWLLLSDFANYMKPTFIPKDNPNQFLFYFDSSDRRVCYVAPERFYTSKGSNIPIQNIDDDGIFSGKDRLTDQMDLFSLGCVIAELYLDGEPLFTLSQLLKYMRNEYKPDLSTIDNQLIREIIQLLINIDPNERPSVSKILNDYRGILFPDLFYDFLYDFMSDLNNTKLYYSIAHDKNVSPSDLRLQRVYDNFEAIKYHLQFAYDPITTSTSGITSGSSRVPVQLSLPGMATNYVIKKWDEIELNDRLDQTALILLQYIFSLMNSLKQPQSKINACELIVALSERVSDEAKLDRCIPNLFMIVDECLISYSKYVKQTSNQNDPTSTMGPTSEHWKLSARAASFALEAATTILLTCSSVSPLNTLIFPEYLIPKLMALANADSKNVDITYLKSTLACCIPTLALISRKFWMLSRSYNREGAHDAATNTPSTTTPKRSTTGRKASLFLSMANDELSAVSYFHLPKEQLDSDFERLAVTLLTDSSTLVKIALVNNILPLCIFFGVDKTNDVILPHLISYLNDVDFELRIAFLKSILKIGPYIGLILFEQYLLPLLVQTLSDIEQFVTIQVLEIFYTFISEKLINPVTDFNAISIYQEILSHTLCYVLHPNKWIRQSVIAIIVAINENLTNADRYCFLYPMIKGYLNYDIPFISWKTLYPSLTKPLTHQSYQLAMGWNNLASSKSLFWQQNNPHSETSSTRSNGIKVPKDLSKSLYFPSKDRKLQTTSSSSVVSNGSSIPLSPEDKKWFSKLKSVGLDEKESWKLLALKSYISHVGLALSHQKNHKLQDVEKEKEEVFNLSKDISPRNIFYDVFFKSDPVPQALRMIETNIEASIPSDSESLHNLESRNSLMLPTIPKIKASLQTVEANVFGEMELSHNTALHSLHPHTRVSGPRKHRLSLASNSSAFSLGNSDMMMDKSELVVIGGLLANDITRANDGNIRKLLKINDKAATAVMKHSYGGHNPNILNYLASIDVEPLIDDFAEFGPAWKNLQENNTDKSTFRGVRVASINTNQNSLDLDAITNVAVCSSNEFVVTSSENGYLKVWDTLKLEKNITVKAPQLLHKLDSSITAMEFLPNRPILAVATSDGMLRILKVLFTRGKTNKIVKYSQFQTIRSLQLNDNDFIIDLKYFSLTTTNQIIGITSKSYILGIDIVRMVQVYKLENPVIFGVTRSFVVDNKHTWLLVGTDNGYLCLWDLRFKQLLKSWRLDYRIDDFEGGDGESNGVTNNGARNPGISNISLLSTNGQDVSQVSITTTSEVPDVTVWQIPSFECTKVFRSYVNGKFGYDLMSVEYGQKVYTLEEVSPDLINLNIEDIIANLEVSDNSIPEVGEKSESSRGITCTQQHKNSLTTATSGRSIVIWNLNDLKLSVSIPSTATESPFTVHTVYPALIFAQQVQDPMGRAGGDGGSPLFNDIITGISVVERSSGISLIVGDRSGYLNVFK